VEVYAGNDISQDRNDARQNHAETNEIKFGTAGLGNESRHGGEVYGANEDYLGAVAVGEARF
jgi:hypothetical protein